MTSVAPTQSPFQNIIYALVAQSIIGRLRNRCFDECLPEVVNRRIVDHIADVNLCYSEHARHYLNVEGLPKKSTFVIDSPMAEVLSDNLEEIMSASIRIGRMF